MLFEISKCLFRNVGDIGNFRLKMSPTLDQPQGFVSSLKSPLASVHDMIDQLQSN